MYSATSTVRFIGANRDDCEPPAPWTEKCSGLSPTTTSRAPFLSAAPRSLGVSGMSKPLPWTWGSSPPVNSASRKFIDGEPMKPATNRLSGEL